MHFPTHEQIIMKMVKNIMPIVIVNETLNNLDNTLFGIWPPTHGTTLFLNFLASKSWWRSGLRWVANESLRPCCSSFQINQRSGSQTQRSYCKTTTFSVNLTIGSVCVDEKHSACKIVLRKVDCKKNGGFNLCLSQLKEKKKKTSSSRKFWRQFHHLKLLLVKTNGESKRSVCRKVLIQASKDMGTLLRLNKKPFFGGKKL